MAGKKPAKPAASSFPPAMTPAEMKALRDATWGRGKTLYVPGTAKSRPPKPKAKQGQITGFGSRKRLLDEAMGD